MGQLVAAIAVVRLRSAASGRRVYLMGDSENLARFNAIDLRRLKFTACFVVALISSLAGVILRTPPSVTALLRTNELGSQETAPTIACRRNRFPGNKSRTEAPALRSRCRSDSEA